MEQCKDLSPSYKEISPIEQVEISINLVNSLMKIPHYAKLTAPVIFMMEQKARTLGMHPLDALNGAMYPTKGGKIELSAEAMNGLIRSRGHSITQHHESTHDRCILVGRRADNGDTMTVSFSLEEAHKAGLMDRSARNPDFVPVWQKYPTDMLFCRALSRLARRLFPDVIKGCYVQGEIVEDLMSRPLPNNEPTILPAEHISPEQIQYLSKIFEETDDQFKVDVYNYLDKLQVNHDFSNFPVGMYQRICNMCKNKKKVISYDATDATMVTVPQE